MAYSMAVLETLHVRQDGRCFLCDRRIRFKNYGSSSGKKNRWEVDHGNPRSRGGVSDLRNLHAVCAPCNRRKSDMTTGEYRRRYGW